MSLSKGVFRRGPDESDFFVGWAAAPAVDRRFLLGALPLGALGAAGLGYVRSRALDDPGAGAWLTSETRSLDGVMGKTPYPMLYVEDAASPFRIRTVLVVAQGKCTQALDIAAVAGQAVKVTGVPIERGRRLMLEVPLALDRWLEPSTAGVKLPPIEAASQGRFSFVGEIMDSKCFFGVMKPHRGKTHKACASLCIRGGIPPAFWVRTKDGREAVLLMTDAQGRAHGDDILPLVGDPVRAEGEVVRVGDILHFRADASAYRRI